MAEDIVGEEQLIQKHKKERKDLQAQIQSLKKTICKGNKKQKKEVTEEIVRLESDLDQKQDEEMANFKLSQVKIKIDDGGKDSDPEEDTEQAESESTEESRQPQRVSKAKRRREKKASEEKERNRRIIEEEAENIFGKRNMELIAIRKILVKRDLVIHEIPSDGHCLYNAVAHQLTLLGLSPFGFQDLRSKTAVYMRENMSDFLPFITSSKSEDLLSPEEYEKYCDNVAETSAWGGAVELQVLSKILECPIEVIQATGVPYIVGDEYEGIKKIVLTYHRHMYELGAHYNSVKKFVAIH
ncbi:deubiquitinase OTUD6B [Belonocnema kinseyi]|uniref:deubiquitinase OTUD6B n=1 Tax=Belonocnema kinseyi TaxID=2817044 RepID=UPI00143D22FA|nr:deubiquitinase OTUD6B [Belonocnema kinseyi]XP_033228663.1 deubiquitinase OTUD6B [Belonocnema kinseyi]